MIAALAAVTVAYLAALVVLTRSHLSTLSAAVGDVTRAADAAQERHDDALDRLLQAQSVEREEWVTERQLLITRIQDPTAGVASSLAYLPPPGEMDMDVDR